MKIGEHQVDLDIKAVRAGQVATFELNGRFWRGPVPCDGLLIESRTASILVPAAEVEAAMRELDRRDPFRSAPAATRARDGDDVER